MENKYPTWIDKFIKLARPGVLVGMFSVLFVGGFIFASIEFIFPMEGARAAEVFTSTLRSFPDSYYDTLQWMFAAYVGGRSAQAIAENLIIKPKVTVKTTSTEEIAEDLEITTKDQPHG